MNVWARGARDAAFIEAALGPRLQDPALGSGAIVVGARPEHVRLDPAGVPGRVRLRETLGRDILLHVMVGDAELRVLASPEAVPDALAPGSEIRTAVDPARWHFFDAGSGARVEPSWQRPGAASQEV
jgi:multiple sugar transport system ATP-binding protein